MAKKSAAVKEKEVVQEDQVTETSTDNSAEAEVAPKPIVPMVVDEITRGELSLKAYNQNAVEEFGQNFAIALIVAAGMEEQASKMLASANEAKQYMAFELTKMALDFSYKHESGKNPVDIYAIYGEPKDVQLLNRNILLHMGVLAREVNDETDSIEYIYTTPELKNTYEYSEALKKKDEEEHTRRFNNRKRLNSRLADALKAAVLLRDQNLSVDDLFYSEDDKGEMVPTIKNAPKAIGGDAGVFQMNARKPVKGAVLSPTMASLIKLANDAHKGEVPAKGADKGETRDAGDINIGDEQFGKYINNVRASINALEGKYSEDQLKQMRALHKYLSDTLKVAA